MLRQVEVAAKLHAGVAQTAIMKDYSISKRQCSQIKADAPRLKQMQELNLALSSRKSLKTRQFPEIEDRLLTFFGIARAAGLSVTRAIFHVQAVKNKDKLLEETSDDRARKTLEKFSASETWVTTFVKRNNLKRVSYQEVANRSPDIFTG